MQYDENAEKYGYEGEMTPLKCDELKAYKADVTIPVYGTIADAEVYIKKDVDAAIAELKEAWRSEHEACEALKAKLEDVQASMYCDVVDANMEIRRMKRVLWIARAYIAEARKNYWYARSIHEGDKYVWSIDGSAVKYIGCIKRTNFDWLKVWSEVECKCLAKAEEYK